MKTLETIATHRQFNSIGTTEGFFFGHKTYLSFDANTGWSLQRLSFFQQILRNALGYFQSTHLPTVFKEYSKFKAENRESIKLIETKIVDAWNKHYLSTVGSPTIRDRFFGIKNYLSYSNREGWSVLKLNYFQQLLRKNLGWYQSTFAHNVLLPWIGNASKMKSLSIDLEASLKKLHEKKLNALGIN